MRVPNQLMRLLRDDRGATAIEYGLILALIAMGIVGAVAGLGGEIIELWTWVETDVLDATGSTTKQPD